MSLMTRQAAHRAELHDRTSYLLVGAGSILLLVALFAATLV